MIYYPEGFKADQHPCNIWNSEETATASMHTIAPWEETERERERERSMQHCRQHVQTNHTILLLLLLLVSKPKKKRVCAEIDHRSHRAKINSTRRKLCQTKFSNTTSLCNKSLQNRKIANKESRLTNFLLVKNTTTALVDTNLG
jgi:hypothetical protein